MYRGLLSWRTFCHVIHLCHLVKEYSRVFGSGYNTNVAHAIEVQGATCLRALALCSSVSFSLGGVIVITGCKGVTQNVTSTIPETVEVWSLTQSFSVNFSKSRVCKEKLFFYQNTTRFFSLVFDGILVPLHLYWVHLPLHFWRNNTFSENFVKSVHLWRNFRKKCTLLTLLKWTQYQMTILAEWMLKWVSYKWNPDELG